MQFICYFLLAAALLQVSALAYGRVSKHVEDSKRGRVARDEGTGNSDKLTGIRSEENLLGNLLSDYNLQIYPGAGTTVQFGIAIICASYDESSRVLTTRAWLRLSWNDARLRWTGSHDATEIRVGAYQLWTPDIKLYNGLEGEQIDQVNAVVSSDGSVFWAPTVTLKTNCHDSGESASCLLKFGSWTYGSNFLSLTKLAGIIVDTTTGYTADCPTRVSDVEEKINTVHYEEAGESYQDVEIKFKISRNN